MMKRVLPPLLGLAAIAAPAFAADLIKPGYWESTNRVISPTPSEKVENRCITPADVAKFMMGPSNRHYTCTYPTRSFQGGKIVLKGACVSKTGRQVAVSGHGVYTPTSYSLTADVAMEFFGLPIAGQAQTDARRIADVCPTPPVAPAAADATPAPQPAPDNSSGNASGAANAAE
jgi:hypothetical protein